MKDEVLTEADICAMETAEQTACTNDHWTEPTHAPKAKRSLSAYDRLQKKRAANAARQRRWKLKAEAKIRQAREMVTQYAAQLRQQKQVRHKIVMRYAMQPDKKEAEDIKIAELVQMNKIQETEIWYDKAKKEATTPKNIVDNLRRQLKLEKLRSAKLVLENARLRKMPKGKVPITLSCKRANGFNDMLAVLKQLDQELSTARKKKLSSGVASIFYDGSLDAYDEIKFKYNVWAPIASRL